MTDDAFPDFLDDYFAECDEHLMSVRRLLVALESSVGQPEINRPVLDAYARAVADPRWQGHYEFILPTVAKRAGLRVEDLGGEGSFVPPGRERSVYVGKSPQGRPPDLTFGFRPPRHDYFHEKPGTFPQHGMLYHPVKPGVPAWTRETRNLSNGKGSA